MYIYIYILRASSPATGLLHSTIRYPMIRWMTFGLICSFVFAGPAHILGMVWILRRPGDPKMGWMALRPRREHCSLESTDLGDD